MAGRFVSPAPRARVWPRERVVLMGRGVPTSRAVVLNESLSYIIYQKYV